MSFPVWKIKKEDAMKDTTTSTHIISSERNWLEGDAIQQLERSAALPGMQRVVGMPDLHPGKGFPIGAGFICKDCVYPHLVGSDIGCGIALRQSDLKYRKIKRDKLYSRIQDMEGEWDGDYRSLMAEEGVTETPFDQSLGTIGAGNHFAELQRVEWIEDQTLFDALGLHKDRIFLAIHSGSRGLGNSILQEHLTAHSINSLSVASEEGQSYLQQHNNAMGWAKINRRIIAQRLLDQIRTVSVPILDLFHNTVEPIEHEGQRLWLHRKGAAPADQGPALIPGTRGTWSYLVQPIDPRWETAFSLAHGAGRKWKRSEAKGKLKKRYRSKDLEITSLGSRVICTDKELLYQEAPEAYKDVEVVVQDMVEANMVSVIAVLRPILTYKVRK